MFRGPSIVNMDNKGRVAISTRHRDRLIENYDTTNLILTIDGSKCLVLYPEQEWEKIEQAISNMPGSDPAVKQLRRFFLGNAVEVELDTQGRILVGQRYRDYANLDKRVAVVGQGIKLELWDADVWDQTSMIPPDDELLALAQSQAAMKLVY